MYLLVLLVRRPFWPVFALFIVTSSSLHGGGRHRRPTAVVRRLITPVCILCKHQSSWFNNSSYAKLQRCQSYKIWIVKEPMQAMGASCNSKHPLTPSTPVVWIDHVCTIAASPVLTGSLALARSPAPPGARGWCHGRVDLGCSRQAVTVGEQGGPLLSSSGRNRLRHVFIKVWHAAEESINCNHNISRAVKVSHMAAIHGTSSAL